MRIYSIFRSIDGEVNGFHQGRTSVFVRVAGCNLRCSYCDTMYAVEAKGKEMSVDEIVGVVKEFGGVKKVTITGGEPLLYRGELKRLLLRLRREGYRVSVETNGSLGIIPLPYGVVGPWLSWVVDWKLPSSGMSKEMKVEDFVLLSPYDFVKFVVGERRDFEEAKEVMKLLREGGCEAQFAFSPVWGKLDPATLAMWVFREELDVVLNLQLHKIIWPDCGEGRER